MQSAEADFYNEAAKSSGYWEKEMTLAMRIFVHLVLANSGTYVNYHLVHSF